MRTEKLSASEIGEQLNTPHKSFAGLDFMPADDFWRLREKYQRLGFNGPARLIFPDDTWPLFKLALARYARKNKIGSVATVVYALNHISAHFGVSLNILDEADFISVKAKLGSANENVLSRVRGFFKFWFQSGVGGLSEEFVKAISKIKLKGVTKGEAVKKHDPHEGPYTPIELQSVIDGCNNAFEEGRLDLDQYALVLLYVQRGARSNQIKNLRVGDFHCRDGKATVSVPRAKQRGVGFREEFSTFPIATDLYRLIHILKRESLKELQRLLPDDRKGLVSQLTDDLIPVFADWEALASDLPEIIKSRKTKERHHLSEHDLYRRLCNVDEVINVHSERTGEPIHLTAQRFRRTLGTDMAREGYGVGPISIALDHTDYQNAGVYVATSADMATRLDLKMGKLLAPLAQAFSGMMVRKESEAIRGDDPGSRIRTISGSDSVGTCGNFSFCGSRAPIACYTCIKFQPWLNAPHDEIAAELYAERQHILDVTGDETIAAQLDRTILAVEDVIRRCEEKRIKLVEIESDE